MFGDIVNAQGESLDCAFHEGGSGADALVVLGHGVTGNKDRPFLVVLAEALAEAGLPTVRFSFSGNGDSGGQFVDSTISKEVDDLGAVLDAAGERAICYVGHSMGGAVGVLRASRDERIRLLVSLAGMVHTTAFNEREFGEVEPDAGCMWDEPECPLSRAYVDDMNSIGTVVDRAGAIQVPWLLVHGSEDDVVPVGDSHDIVAANPRIRADRSRRSRPRLQRRRHRADGLLRSSVDKLPPHNEHIDPLGHPVENGKADLYPETGRQASFRPLLLIIALAAGVLLFIWIPEALHRQKQVMQSMLVLVVGLLLSVLWLLFASRLPWKTRWRILGIVVLVALVPAVSLRIGGFSGDLVPIPEWRWTDLWGGSSSATDEGGRSSAAARDYPRFLGPDHNATLTGVALETNWKLHPPQQMWRQPVGPAWSAFAVSGDLALTQEQDGAVETVVARELLTGRRRWTHRDSTRYETSLAGVGPRATPTIVQGRVFTVGGTGLLNALELATGELLWQRDIIVDNGSRVNQWGVSCSPLVLDSLVVVTAGGPDDQLLVAYHRDTGDRIWTAGNATAGYSSPTLLTLAGIDQILTFNFGLISSHRPDTGEVLWQQPWSGGTQPVAQPLPLPIDRLLVSSGYGIGSKLFQLRAGAGEITVDILWESTRLKAKFTNPVFHDGFVYGLDDGTLVCLDPETGQRRWKKGRYGHGQVLLADDILLVQAESGDLFLVQATPEAHRELAHLQALTDKTWNNPTLATPYLLVRNHKEAACYRLAVRHPAAVTLRN